jgi:hypothetical protein
MVRIAIIACLLFFAACSPSSAPKSTVQEITGSRVERVASISAMLSKQKIPPTAIVDAHFVEEQVGDGVLGPSDFRTFYSLEVASQDVSRWVQTLTPLEATATYGAPAQPRDWWIAHDTFGALQFYKPDTWTGRANGWIGVSPQTGRIYIFTFTM